MREEWPRISLTNHESTPKKAAPSRRTPKRFARNSDICLLIHEFIRGRSHDLHTTPRAIFARVCALRRRTLDLSIMHECQNNSCGIREIRVAKSKRPGSVRSPAVVNCSGCALESLLQSNIPVAAFDRGQRFVVAVLKVAEHKRRL